MEEEVSRERGRAEETLWKVNTLIKRKYVEVNSKEQNESEKRLSTNKSNVVLASTSIYAFRKICLLLLRSLGLFILPDRSYETELFFIYVFKYWRHLSFSRNDFST